MSLPRFSVNRPVTITMAFLGVLLLGAISLSRLPIDMLPEMEPPMISILTMYSGTAAEDIENEVTRKIENALASIDNIKEITSVSQEGLSAVTCQFDWGSDLNNAVNDIREALDRLSMFLPDDIEKPIIFRFNTTMIPVMVAIVTADESYPQINRLVDEQLCKPLTRLPDVGVAQVMGGLERQINVDVDRGRMEMYGLSMQQIMGIIAAGSTNMSAGDIKISDLEYQIRVPGEYTSVEQIANLILLSNEGKVVRLSDVAEANDGFAEAQMTVYDENRRYGAALFVQKRSGTNTVAVVDQVMAELEELKKNLPPDVNVTVVMDGGEDIRKAINNLATSIILGGLFVILVTLFFLRDWKGSLIISLAIPFSIIISFIYCFIMGYTLNMISLMSLAIAIGMVVDNAVVILENTTRHLEQGERPRAAAVYGSMEVAIAVMASTMTTVVVFVPLIFVGGLTGVIFHQLAQVVVITLLASLFTATSLIPMLSSMLLKSTREQNARRKKTSITSRFYNWSEKIFVNVENFYGSLLDLVLRKKAVTLTILVVLGGLSLLMIPMIGSEFIPEEDTNSITIEAVFRAGTRMEETEKNAELFLEIINEEVPFATNVMFRYGAGGGGMAMGQKSGSHVLAVNVRLESIIHEGRRSSDIAAGLRDRLLEIPGISTLEVSAGDPMATMLTGGGSPVNIEIRGEDLEQSQEYAEKVLEVVRNTPGTVNARLSLDPPVPELQIIPDRDKASSLGMNIHTMADTVRTSLYGRTAARFRDGGEEFDVYLRYRDEDRSTIEDIEEVVVPSQSGAMVKLRNVATVEEELGPSRIDRKDQERLITVQSSIYQRVLSEVVGDIQQKLEDMPPPPGIGVVWSGAVQEQEAAFADLRLLLLLAITLVYMVMASLFESLLHPFVVMFSLPFAFVGVILSLALSCHTLSIVSFIGMVILMGVVVNNAIVLVDYTNTLRLRGQNLHDAIITAGKHRLRPVLMTALTTSGGLLPMALKTGEGAEVFNPLGITVVGGLLTATVATLVLVPLMYSILETRLTERRSRDF